MPDSLQIDGICWTLDCDIEGQMCIVIYIASRECVLFNLGLVDTGTQVSGTFKSYVTKDRIYNIDESLCTHSCSLDVITSSCPLVSEVTRMHSDTWREFMPRDCESIVVRPYNQKSVVSDLGADSMSTVLNILAGCIENMMNDLGWDCIVLHGRPLHEFLGLMRKYECHYVYPHDWSDDIGDLETFHSMEVAHHSDVAQSHANFVPNSFGIVISDNGYTGIRSHALTIYLPSDQSNVVHRNEFDMYIAIGLPKDVTKPYNSSTMEFRDTNIATVLSSIHVEIPDINLLFHPSAAAYIDVV